MWDAFDTDLVAKVFSFCTFSMLCTLDTACCNSSCRPVFLTHISSSAFICTDILNTRQAFFKEYRLNYIWNGPFDWVASKQIYCSNLKVDLYWSIYEITPEQLKTVVPFIIRNKHHFDYLELPMDYELMRLVRNEVVLLRCKSLKFKRCNHEKLTDKHLIGFLSMVTGLLELELPSASCCTLTEVGYRFIAEKYPLLRSISVASLERMNSLLLKCPHLSSVTTVDMPSNGVIDAMAHITNNLTKLAIEDAGAYVSIEGLHRLVYRCGKDLQYLQLTTTKVSDETVSMLTMKCTNLVHVDFCFAGITGISLTTLAMRCKLLERVLCAYTEVDDKGFKCLLLNCNRVNVLRFDRCHALTDASAFAAAHFCTDLIYVNFSNCSITDKYTEKLLANNKKLMNVSYDINLGTAYRSYKEYFGHLTRGDD